MIGYSDREEVASIVNSVSSTSQSVARRRSPRDSQGYTDGCYATFRITRMERHDLLRCECVPRKMVASLAEHGLEANIFIWVAKVFDISF